MVAVSYGGERTDDGARNLEACAPIWATGTSFWPYSLLVGMSNAINLTGRPDGLAGGVSARSLALALASTAVVSPGTAYGWLPLFGGVRSPGDARAFSVQCPPGADLYGDTGSLALGAALRHGDAWKD